MPETCESCLTCLLVRVLKHSHPLPSKKPVVLFRGDTAVDFSKCFDNPKLAKSCGSKFRRVFTVLNKAYHDRFIVVDRGTKLEDVEEIVRCEEKSFIPKKSKGFC